MSRMGMREDGARGVVLMGDSRVMATPVCDTGEELVDIRDHGLRVSLFRADGAGDFAYARAGVAARLRRAAS